jgi:hypothetical protein
MTEPQNGNPSASAILSPFLLKIAPVPPKNRALGQTARRPSRLISNGIEVVANGSVPGSRCTWEPSGACSSAKTRHQRGQIAQSSRVSEDLNAGLAVPDQYIAALRLDDRPSVRVITGHGQVTCGMDAF